MLSHEEIYQKYIKSLPEDEKTRLIARISEEIIGEYNEKSERSIMELRELGKNIWKDIDAQEYVDALRNEWNHRP